MAIGCWGWGWGWGEEAGRVGRAGSGGRVGDGGWEVAMGQNPNRTSEHPNPTTQIGPNTGGKFSPKWYHWF